jgi:hypothetical protein
MSRTRGPCSHLEDDRNVASGKDCGGTQKRNILAENEKNNGGQLRDDVTGEKLVRPKKYEGGKRPPDNEAQVDHGVPRSHGGSNSNANAWVRSRISNMVKNNK